VASSDAQEVAKNADILVICVPRFHLEKLLSFIKPVIKAGAVAVSLIQGHGPGKVRDGKPCLASSEIQEALGGVPTAVLVGANVSHEVAEGYFCEATLATDSGDDDNLLGLLFHRPSFQVRQVHDIAGAEMASTLNCVIGLAAGLCDGLGLGGNTKAAIIRIGLLEVERFTSSFFPSAKRETLFESCGVAGLISISMSSGDKHRRSAEIFAKQLALTKRLVENAKAPVQVQDWPSFSAAVWKNIEENELAGASVWGVETLRTIWPLVLEKSLQNELRLMASLHRIVICGEAPSMLVQTL